MKFKSVNKRFLATVMTASFVFNPILKLSKDYNKYAQHYILPSIENEFDFEKGNGFNKLKRKKRR